MYSYNFHSLWLICDIIIICNLFYLLQKKVLRQYPYVLFIFFLIILSLFYSFLSKGFHFISLLSFWDNYKHVFLFIFSFHLIKKINAERKTKFINRLFIISSITFCIQVLFVFYQKKIELNFDNIAGTLGDGSTHALGYFSLFFIVFLVSYKKPIAFISVVIFFSIIINYFAENIGFYLLLGMSLFFVLSKQIGKIKIIFLSSILVLLIAIVGGEIKDQYLGRAAAFSVTESYTGPENLRTDRGALTGYAVFLGGVWGQGFGSYSEIYGMEGWKFQDLINDQICISEATHLISEIGFVGFFLSILLYITLFNKRLKNKQVKVYSIVFFILAMFYNRLLMDERIFFFFFLTIFVWVLSMEIDLKKKATLLDKKISHIF